MEWNDQQKRNYERLKLSLDRVCEEYNRNGLQELNENVIELARKRFGHWMLVISDLEDQINKLDTPTASYDAICKRYENGWVEIFKRLKPAKKEA